VAGWYTPNKMLSRVPLFAPALGWVAGIAAARTDMFSWSVLAWLLAAMAALACRHRYRIFALALLAGIVWGAVSLMWDARSVAVDATWMTGVRTVSADVVGARYTPTYVRLTLEHVRREDGRGLNGRAWLYMYGRTAGRPGPGDSVRARVHWHTPRNHNNPGGFDFAAYCFDRHIALIGSARGRVRILASHPSMVERLRGRIRHALAPLPVSQRGVLDALLLADRSHIPINVHDAFAATGTAHLLAISGLHVGMTGAIGFGLCWWLLTRREAWMVALPVRGIALTAGAVLAVAYASLAGWPLPAERAAMMLAAAVLAWWFMVGTAALNTLLAALMLILLWDAQAVESVSLWLSFCATAAILIWAGRRRPGAGPNFPGWMMSMLAVTLLAGLATLPLIAGIFGLLPVYSLPANMLMVPLYSMGVLPLALAASALACLGLSVPATVLFTLAGYGVEAGNHLLLWMEQLPEARLWLPSIPWWNTLFYVAGVTLALALLWRNRRVGATLTAAVVLIVYSAAAVRERPPGAVRFIAWDVGQGAAASLITPDGGVMQVDAPGRPGSRFNGGSIVAAGLRTLGLTHVDVLAVTHAQSDHMGGALRLVQQVNHVRELWLADIPAIHAHPGIQRLIRSVRSRNGAVRWLKRGDTMMMGGIACRVLWPPAGYAPSNTNNASLVLSLRFPHRNRLLLPGDIEAEAEKKLLAAGLGPHGLMLMPHHGSRTSSTPAFVRALRPGVVIAQTGYANRYGFPRAEIVRRYRELGADVWNTAHAATITEWVGTLPEAHTHYAAFIRSEKREHALQWRQRADNLR